MERSIKHQFRFPQPPEVVWEYLTNSELLAQWLMPNNFVPIQGHKFQFNTKPKINFGFDGTVHCEVLEIVHLQKLVYSWKGGMSKEKPMLDTIVTWTLTSLDTETVLTLEHTGFRGVKNIMVYFIMNKGWAKIGKRLFKQINIATHDHSSL
jgi:uncharacterized protein YndB with AHSA1/START domain